MYLSYITKKNRTSRFFNTQKQNLSTEREIKKQLSHFYWLPIHKARYEHIFRNDFIHCLHKLMQIGICVSTCIRNINDRTYVGLLTPINFYYVYIVTCVNPNQIFSGFPAYSQVPYSLSTTSRVVHKIPKYFLYKRKCVDVNHNSVK